MTLKQIASLGKELAKFLARFSGCFRSRPGFALLTIYIQGLLSSLQSKNVEAIALEFGKPPRTLQRFVHLSYSGPGFQCLLDSELYLSQEWANDPERRKKLYPQRLGIPYQTFVSNRVPGERGISLRWLLRVAFGRCSVENCFRQAKEELGLDHYEVRGWRCLHRHFYLTQLSHLFCARIRQKFDAATPHDDPLEHLTTEQVRRAMNTWLEAAAGRLTKTERFERELTKQQYYQRRNAQARRSHTKRRKARLKSLGIDADSIKSCIPRTSG